MYKRTKTTLCWKCSRACGRCSWSKNFTPVEGWVAVKTKVRESHEGAIDSYVVLKCPLFDDDTGRCRPNNKIAPILISRPQMRTCGNKSALRRKIEALPVDELERRIDAINYNPEIARLALIEKKTNAEICYIVCRSNDSVRKIVSNILHKVEEAV